MKQASRPGQAAEYPTSFGAKSEKKGPATASESTHRPRRYRGGPSWTATVTGPLAPAPPPLSSQYPQSPRSLSGSTAGVPDGSPAEAPASPLVRAVAVHGDEAVTLTAIAGWPCPAMACPRVLGDDCRSPLLVPPHDPRAGAAPVANARGSHGPPPKFSGTRRIRRPESRTALKKPFAHANGLEHRTSTGGNQPLRRILRAPEVHPCCQRNR